MGRGLHSQTGQQLHIFLLGQIQQFLPCSLKGFVDQGLLGCQIGFPALQLGHSGQPLSAGLGILPPTLQNVGGL